MWNNTRAPSGRTIDVLLVPTMAHTAVPHRTIKWVAYTKIWNALDYTALSFPAGKTAKELDWELPSYEPRNPLDEWNWQQYDIEKMDGLSVGLQIVGRRLEEEKVLGVAHQIECFL
jgi:amidase